MLKQARTRLSPLNGLPDIPGRGCAGTGANCSLRNDGVARPRGPVQFRPSLGCLKSALPSTLAQPCACLFPKMPRWWRNLRHIDTAHLGPNCRELRHFYPLV